MPCRNDIAKILIIGSVTGFILSSSVLAGASFQKTVNDAKQENWALRCGNGPNQSLAGMFANPHHQWQKYSSVEDIPQLNGDDGEIAFAVKDLETGKAVCMIADGEDYSSFQESQFSRAGELKSIHYEMRTAWGWGVAESCSFVGGAIFRRTIRFFDTESGRTIPRPRQADDVPNFLKPEIYSSFNTLPFIAIFNKPRTDAPQK
jgi:hypothetical protein